MTHEAQLAGKCQILPVTDQLLRLVVITHKVGKNDLSFWCAIRVP